VHVNFAIRHTMGPVSRPTRVNTARMQTASTGVDSALVTISLLQTIYHVDSNGRPM